MRTIHSRRWGPALQTYLDGEATARRRTAVVRHVSDCPDCASELVLLRRMHDVLARLRGGKRPDPAVTRLRSHAAHFSA